MRHAPTASLFQLERPYALHRVRLDAAVVKLVVAVVIGMAATVVGHVWVEAESAGVAAGQ